MKTYIPCIAIILLFVCLQVRAQEAVPRDSVIKRAWILGLGYNIVEDSDQMLNNFLAIKSQWNAVPFPSRVSIGRYFNSGLGLEAIASYNQYGQGKLIDRRINDADKEYWGIDARLSYDLNKILGETGWFDPYVGIGAGYTDANEQPRGTYNAVIGFRTWFSDQWGLDLNSSGKWSFGTAATNHLQHAAGVVFRFGIKKGVVGSLDDESMAELPDEVAQNKLDSLARDTRAAEEASALADRLARDKELARLQQEEATRLATENERKQGIHDAINALGKVYFDLNSSYLNPAAKKLLDQFAGLMEVNPTVTLKVIGHADSRGRGEYNHWLSGRRAKRTVDYLISRGIGSQRLEYEGQGEQHLTNHCRDNVTCSETEHGANRRTEFVITGY